MTSLLKHGIQEFDKPLCYAADLRQNTYKTNHTHTLSKHRAFSAPILLPLTDGVKLPQLANSYPPSAQFLNKALRLRLSILHKFPHPLIGCTSKREAKSNLRDKNNDVVLV